MKQDSRSVQCTRPLRVLLTLLVCASRGAVVLYWLWCRSAVKRQGWYWLQIRRKKKIMSETEVGPATNPVCQRCFQLRHYSSALSVAVPESKYLRSLQILKNKGILILLMVDVTDFPGSLFPNLSSLIRPGNPVANKVDLLPSGFEVDKRRLEKHLRELAILHLQN